MSIYDNKQRCDGLATDVFDLDFVNVVNVEHGLALTSKELTLPLNHLSTDRIGCPYVCELVFEQVSKVGFQTIPWALSDSSAYSSISPVAKDDLIRNGYLRSSSSMTLSGSVQRHAGIPWLSSLTLSAE